MPEIPPPQQESPPQRHKGWFVITLYLAIIMACFSFLSLVGYYIWQIHYNGGEAALLEAKFASAIESSGKTAGNTINTDGIIRPHNPTLGQPEAPLTLILFEDFECPYCREAHATIHQIIETYSPAIYVVFKHVPITTIHEHAFRASVAATCAEEQQAFWPYRDLLFTKQQLDDTSYLSYANELGLDMSRFSYCLSAETYASQITEDLQDAATIGLKGTPTYILNGKKIEGALSKEIWDTLIIDALTQKP